jgi:4-amino-4-deoxy-L-arabinose transferase-like glycosyltransferase
VGGLAYEVAPLPYGLGALSIKLLGPWLDPTLAARVPFALLLVAVLTLLWYATFHLARSDAAQPVALAFGGEAHPIDYARAIADGALLSLIATLGLLQLGHETTPELAQLTAVSLFLYGIAAAPYREVRARLAAVLSLPMLAASGAPTIALGLAACGALVCRRSSMEPLRRFSGVVIISGALAAILATMLGAWAVRLAAPDDAEDVWQLLRQLLWFLWPTWTLAVWTLLQWRAQWLNRHIALPGCTALVAVAASLAMGGSDRALMLATPAFAMLAAFALPTFKRSLSAAIDWFSVCFFSAGAIAIWVVYSAIHTGVPAKPAANVARLAPGFEPHFSWLPLVFAALGTFAWLWLVRWRTGRHRHALWKSLVLPASGVALCWLLAMTLWLPGLDYARSLRPQVDRIAQHVPRGACVEAPGLARAQLSALESLGGWRVRVPGDTVGTSCNFLLRAEPVRGDPPTAPPGWRLVARERRPTDREELIAIYRRID